MKINSRHTLLAHYSFGILLLVLAGFVGAEPGPLVVDRVLFCVQKSCVTQWEMELFFIVKARLESLEASNLPKATLTHVEKLNLYSTLVLTSLKGKDYETHPPKEADLRRSLEHFKLKPHNSSANNMRPCRQPGIEELQHAIGLFLWDQERQQKLKPGSVLNANIRESIPNKSKNDFISRRDANVVLQFFDHAFEAQELSKGVCL